jgi:hypothetical protein
MSVGKRSIDVVGGAVRRVRRVDSRRLAVEGAKAAALVAILAVGLFVIASTVSSLYSQYGYHPEKNARTWAALTPVFSDSASCRRCHEPEYSRWTRSEHGAVACESCHGPLSAHSLDQSVVAGEAAARSNEICAACHAKVVGRPERIPQPDLTAHYGSRACLQCHDAHSAVAVRPPVLSHPLADLPACATCHGAEGMKPMPADHQRSIDDACLACHVPVSSAAETGEERVP